mmetsp:Transcript_21916/g.85885  ORF Transcript_21916/g.85885 Transcript_21916/m.85885 type:complete len:200 (+) Transcript_21916:1401-2000(+)
MQCQSFRPQIRSLSPSRSLALSFSLSLSLCRRSALVTERLNGRSSLQSLPLGFHGGEAEAPAAAGALSAAPPSVPVLVPLLPLPTLSVVAVARATASAAAAAPAAAPSPAAAAPAPAVGAAAAAAARLALAGGLLGGPLGCGGLALGLADHEAARVGVALEVGLVLLVVVLHQLEEGRAELAHCELADVELHQLLVGAR